MCSIVGLQGNVNAQDIVKMLKSSKNRGPDSSGIYLDKCYNDINLDEFADDNDYKIAFGHNLLSIYDSNDRSSKSQPITKDNLVLVFNGEIYNFHTIRNFLKKVGVEDQITSDSEALLHLIEFYNKLDLLKATQAAIRLIDGDYAFAIWDGQNLAISRDQLGVKPLFYGENGEIKGFASTRQALKEIGITDINTLKPEHILYNWQDVAPTQPIYEKVFDGDVSKIDKMLRLSIIKRVDGLYEAAVIILTLQLEGILRDELGVNKMFGGLRKSLESKLNQCTNEDSWEKFLNKVNIKFIYEILKPLDEDIDFKEDIGQVNRNGIAHTGVVDANQIVALRLIFIIDTLIYITENL